jgi:hypothetical protein
VGHCGDSLTGSDLLQDDFDLSRSGSGSRGRNDRLGFDFHAPFGVEKGGDNHGGGGPDGGKDFAVGEADLFPVFGVGDEHAGADDIGEGGTGLIEGGFDDAEDGAGLVGGGEVFGANGASAGDVDEVADAYGAGEADDRFIGRGAGNVNACHGWMISVFERPSDGAISHEAWACSR